MPKPLPTQDIDPNIFVINKPYSEKRLPSVGKNIYLSVNIGTFSRDIQVFDQEMRLKYTNAQIVLILKLIFKKAAERIIKKLWRMPFPNGIGSLYVTEAQITRKYKPPSGDTRKDAIAKVEAMEREIKYGVRKTFLKWNKLHKNIPYRNIWSVRPSKGFFRQTKYEEIRDRVKGNGQYRGHII